MLYKHQIKIIEENKPTAGLFLGTGSGKTRTALHLAKGRTLIIAPKMQVQDKNWERELSQLNLATKITVISKERFRRDWDKLPPADTIIVDEAHTCLGVTPSLKWVKGKQIPKASQLFESLVQFIQKYKPKRFYLATATIMRSPMTVWAAAVLLGHNWNWYEFRSAFYMKLPMPGRDVWRPRTDSVTKDRLAKAVQKIGYVGRLEDYFDVPDQNYKDVFVDLTKEQEDRIEELKLEYPDPLVNLGKTLQVENGVLAGDEFSPGVTFNNAKIEKLVDYSYEFPRMIVFAKYRQQIDSIAKAIEQTGKKVFVLTGDTKDRGTLMKEINNCSDYAFICSAQISAGWEVPNCPVIIFASRTYSFVDYDQALGRIQRVNNIKKNLYINLIVEGGIDEAVHDAIVDKQDFNERIYLKI